MATNALSDTANEESPKKKTNLTDRFIRSRKPAPKGKRLVYSDGLVPGLALRVTDRGHRSFVLMARFPLKPSSPTYRTLGDCYLPPDGENGGDVPPLEIRHGALTLTEARAKARHWLDLIARGVDPKVEEERQKAAEIRKQNNTFGAVADEFVASYASKIKKSAEAKRIVEAEFKKRWAARPITDITDGDVRTAITAIVKRGSPYQAHNAFGYLRLLFNWAIGAGGYGITASPTQRLSPKMLIGEKKARNRTLADDELRAIWAAAAAMGEPYGPLVRLLLLTGQREREIADASWPEVDFANKLLTIPVDRMKMGVAHQVPLCDEALSIIKRITRPDKKDKKGEFIFSTTNGQKAVNGFSKAKARLDKLIAEDRVKARAGKEHAKPEKQDYLPPWVFHDLRRAVRTHLSALPVQEVVRERVIAHLPEGIKKHYDLYAYADEKRDCLAKWETRLKAILNPPPTEVADLAAERAAREGGKG